MSQVREWPGTEQESAELLAALGRNCSCTTDPAGKRIGTCPAHQLLLAPGQPEHLLFGRRLRDRLVIEEFTGVYDPW